MSRKRPTKAPHAVEPVYSGLRFSFADMEREIDNLGKLAEQFLTVESSQFVMPAWKQQLVNFKNSQPKPTLRWEIPHERPIQTKASEGAYEREPRRGGLTVYGTISVVWEISVEKSSGSGSNPTFLLTGLASTKIKIWQCHHEHPFEIARWTLDIGDTTSPGCHFHTQIQLDPADNKFPGSLSVPRFPAFLHTPMDALDFLLGELFQSEWYERVSRSSDPLRHWNGCQKERLTRMLGWHARTINEAKGSPWIALKRKKPLIGMLCN
jgi:hypothetical protein